MATVKYETDTHYSQFVGTLSKSQTHTEKSANEAQKIKVLLSEVTDRHTVQDPQKLLSSKFNSTREHLQTPEHDSALKNIPVTTFPEAR